MARDGSKQSRALPNDIKALRKHVNQCRSSQRGGMWRIAESPGLNLRVKPDTGFASYVVRYQVGKGSERSMRTEAVGEFDRLPLGDARLKAKEYDIERARGHDPVQEKRDATEAAKIKGLTLRQLFEERAANPDIDTTTITDYRSSLELNAKSILDQPAADITPQMIVKVLEVTEARSKAVTNNLRAALSSTFRWGMARHRLTNNPVRGLAFTHRPKERNRKLSEAEIKRLWQAIDSDEFGSTEPMRIALKLIMLTAQRTGEVMGAKLSELQLDGAAPRWIISAERMKVEVNREQIVPLSTQAVTLFRRAVELAEAKGSTHVFPGTTHGRHQGIVHTHMCRNAATKAMREVRKLAKVHDIRNHDMRKVVVTWLGERLERSEVLDMILHHARRSTTAKFYNFAMLEGPMRTALQDWADQVWRITGQSAPVASNVHHLASARA